MKLRNLDSELVDKSQVVMILQQTAKVVLIIRQFEQQTTYVLLQEHDLYLVDAFMIEEHLQQIASKELLVDVLLSSLSFVDYSTEEADP